MTVIMTSHINDYFGNVNDLYMFHKLRWHTPLHSIPNTSCFRLVFMLFLYMWHGICTYYDKSLLNMLPDCKILLF
jgi:hypothetical protein